MKKEYGNIGKEYAHLTELQNVHESFGTGAREYFENGSEYGWSAEEYLATMPQTTLEQEKRKKEKEKKRHFQLVKKMVYTVASAVTVFSMAQTIEPMENPDKVPSSEIVGTEDSDRVPPSGQMPSTEDDVVIDITKAQTVVFSGSGTLTKEMVEEEFAKYEFPNGCIVVIEGFTAIGDSAFSSCDELVKVMIPNSVELIEGSAFSNCNNLIIDKLVTANKTIGGSAFFGVTLKEVEISESYKPSEEYWSTFNGANVESVSFEVGITRIPDRSLENCKKLAEVVIPNTVREIGDSAFSSCDELVKVTIPNSVELIEGSAFSNCNNLIIDKLVTANKTIGVSAFSGVTLKEVEISESYKPSEEYWSTFNDANVESVSFEVGITRIPDRSLENCKKLAEVVIPNTVKEIGSGAFSSCDELVKVTIPNSVELIGDSAFLSCDNLIIDKLVTANKTIGGSAFSGVTLKEVEISESYKPSEEYWSTFNGANVESVSFEVGITRIPDRSLENCKKLAEVVIPNTVKEIGSGAFSSCDELAKVTIPNSVELIGDSAFSNCDELVKVTIPNSVELIEGSAFSNCNNLIIDKLVTANKTIGGSAFSGVTLKEVEISESYKPSEAFWSTFNGANVESVSFEVGITRIPDRSLENCKKLAEVVIPNTVKEIGSSAFSSCDDLVKVIIPNSVELIEKGAFRYCNNLTEIIMSDDIDVIEDGAFD